MEYKTDERVWVMKEGCGDILCVCVRVCVVFCSSQLYVSGIYHLLQQAALFMQTQQSFYLPKFLSVHLIKTLQREMDQKQFFKTKIVPSLILALIRN